MVVTDFLPGEYPHLILNSAPRPWLLMRCGACEGYKCQPWRAASQQVLMQGGITTMTIIIGHAVNIAKPIL